MANKTSDDPVAPATAQPAARATVRGGPAADLTPGYEAEIARERAKQRQPAGGTRAFKVHVQGLPSFKRAGITFTGQPVTVNAEDLTADQITELLNTPHLVVEELTITSKDAVKPGAGAAAAAGPAPESLRKPGDAPVPSPTAGQPTRIVGGIQSQEIGGMSVEKAKG